MAGIKRITAGGKAIDDTRFSQIAPATLASTPAYPGGPRMVRSRVGDDLGGGKHVRRVGTAAKQGMTGSIGMGNAGSEPLGLEP